jgi:uncharacterized protein YjiS (DUF1127 family)
MNITTQHRIPLIEALFSTITTQYARVLSGLKTNAKRRAIYRQTVAELGGLSARELADIGIPRTHIRRVARESAREI